MDTTRTESTTPRSLLHPTEEERAVAAPAADAPPLRTGPSAAADRPEQGRLYDLCFGKTDGERVVPWRYDGNPHGATIAPIARDEAGAMVSSYACQPRRVLWRGATSGVGVVGQTGDVMTHPELRSKGIFSELHWQAMGAAREAGWAAAWGLPNKYSGRIFFGKLGWVLAGHIGPWNFVLRNDERARAIRLHNGRLAALGVPFAVLRGRVRRKALRRGSGGLVAERLERFPEEVGAMTRAAAERHEWMVERGADYLDWRFLDAPSGRFRALGVRDAGGTLVAYAALQLPDPTSGLAAISDLVGVDAAAEDAAVEAALAELEARGAAVVRAYGMRGSPWEAVLARGGFRRPRGYKPVGAFALVEDELGHTTLDTSRWYFTDGDRDDELVR